MKVSDEEIIAEYERQIAAGTDLDGLIPVKAKTPPSGARRTVFSVRLSSEELAAIGAAARARGISIGDFIREAATRTAALESEKQAGEYSLEALKADYEALGRRLDQTIANQRRRTAKPRAKVS